MQLILKDLRHAFTIRLSEWAFAVILAMWGLVLLLPEPLFERETWTAFRYLFHEETLGLLFAVGGILRLLVLAANGAWRPMYYVRAWMALSSAIVWFSITIGLLSSGRIGTWIAVYPVLFVFDVVNALRAVSDAAANDRQNNAGAVWNEPE